MAGLAVTGETRSRGGIFGPSIAVDRAVTVGVPVDVHLFWRPTASVGIGISGLTNLNRRKSFAFAAFAVRFGRQA